MSQSILQVKMNNLSFLALKLIKKNKKQLLSSLILSQNTELPPKWSCTTPIDIQVTVHNGARKTLLAKQHRGPAEPRDIRQLPTPECTNLLP